MVAFNAGEAIAWSSVSNPTVSSPEQSETSNNLNLACMCEIRSSSSLSVLMADATRAAVRSSELER
jgi:hypothetical protein